MNNNECYELSPSHRGEVREYTDGVYTHPLCDRHAEECGFKAPMSHDDFLASLGY